MTENNVDTLYFNGIDATTGTYSLPPMTTGELSAAIQGTLPDDETSALNSYFKSKSTGHYGIVEGHDPLKLEESGWGIVFSAKADPAIIDALKPLMEWRKQQAGQYYKEYIGGMAGVRPNDTKGSWLARQNVPNFGPVDPDLIPYYIMLVGQPSEIDYRFQYLLDVQYGVGRICFDTPEEYAYYAQSVVEAEKKQLQLQRKLSFFGVSNPDDAATKMSANNLILPLAEYLTNEKLKDQSPWQIDAVLRDEALKSRLADFMGGKDTPALLFTASHGMCFPNGDPKQFRHQGALLCQDWTGPRQWQGPISENLYFSADDLSSDANLWGTIAFLFACYGAGTPLYDEFTKQAFKDQRAQIAPNAFLSRLPQKMLSHPKGGALAVVGHVERAWGYSFVWGGGRSLNAFNSTMTRLMTGAPIGYAFEVFNERYGEFSTELTQTLDDAQWSPVDPNELAGKWTANNDAKNYVVIGDPAVRAMVAPQAPDGGAAPAIERPSINLADVKAGANFAAEPSPADAAAATPAPIVVVETFPAAGNGSGGGPEFGEVNYGLLDNFQQAAGNVGNAMQQFVQKLGTFLGEAIDNAMTLEVATYTSTTMEQVSIKGGVVSGAQLRAMTNISIDGDTKQVIPLNADGDVDAAIWALHLEMVKQAQEARTELIRSIVSSASGLANLGGSK
jgi:hypothetical protein